MNKKSDFIVGLSQDWTHLLYSIYKREFNFINFHFLTFEIEVDKIVGRIEIYIGIIGFNLFIAIPYEDLDEDLQERIDSISNST